MNGMIRPFASLVALVAVTAGAGGALAAPGADLDTDRRRYRPGREVVIRLVNDTNAAISFENPWRIKRVTNGRTVATLTWDSSRTTVAAGARRTWRWNQRKGDCATDCTYQGGETLPRAGPGRYAAIVTTSAGRLRTVFEVGRFFTLGFREQPDVSFVVFAIERKPISQMKAEAAAEEKTLIVSGIVRGARGYNDPWSYTMGPGSIILAEVFTEVCDASPDHVENNLDAWKGERWCPWSSYVARVGR
jgi:hypothetical protein